MQFFDVEYLPEEGTGIEMMNILVSVADDENYDDAADKAVEVIRKFYPDIGHHPIKVMPIRGPDADETIDYLAGARQASIDWCKEHGHRN